MRHIMVGVDGSPQADRALRWAAAEARLHGAAIELVHGYTVHPHAGMIVHDLREPAQAALDAVVARNGSVLEGLTCSTRLVPLLWSPADALADPAAHTDLVVVGSRGLGGFAELVLGSTSYRAAAHATVPVAVIRGGDEPLDGRRPLVVGIDGSPTALRALRWALAEAGRRGVTLTAVHAYAAPVAWSPAAATDEQMREHHARLHDDAVALLDRALAAVDVPDGVAVERAVVSGPPAATLLDRAGPQRLLVVGTAGRGALGRTLLGSVSHQSLHHTAGPVVVVP